MNIREVSALNVFLVVMFFLSLSFGKVTTGNNDGIEIGLYFLFLFLWGARSDDTFAPAIVLFLGFFQDALTGSALGFWSIIFLVFFGLVRSQSQIISLAPKSGLFFIVFFSILAAYVMIAGLAFVSLETVDYVDMVGSFLITAIIVPFATVFLSYVIPLGHTSYMRRH